MWATSLLTIMLLFPLLSAAPLDIAGGVEDDNDGLHSHDENVTRGGKHFGHNQFDFSVNDENVTRRGKHFGHNEFDFSVRDENVTRRGKSFGHNQFDYSVSDENVTRRGKSFDHNEFDFSVSVEGDVGSIGHEVNIDVYDGHTDDHHHLEDDAVIECKEELRVLYKSIDSNKNGLMDARELLRVCHQNNFQVTETSAVRILTLPDKTVGFNLAKFCELLKDCPSTNSADLIYFLLELYDKVKNPGRLCQKRIISSSVCSFLPLICPGLHLKSNCTLLDLKLHFGVTCPHKDDLSDVLLENNWRTQNQINAMSENMQRNTVVVEVEKMTGHTIEDLQGRANAGNLGSLTAIAKMSGLLIKDSIKSSSDVETMEYSDLRHTLIVEASQRFSIEVGILHSMTDRQLLKTFCTGCEVHVGKSTSNTISATVTEGCVCPTVVNQGNWLVDGTYPNEFTVTQDGSSLQVQRTDSNIGWSMDLSFNCKDDATEVTCSGPATLLSTSPGGDMALCKDETATTCQKDVETLCPAGWNVCTPGQFNNRNDGWDYNWQDANAGVPFGVIYCFLMGGASNYEIFSNPVLNIDEPLNCAVDINNLASRPDCEAFAGVQDCANKDFSALCCTPTSTCGDGEVQLEEDCDDGNNSDTDDCLNTCTWTYPGDYGQSAACPTLAK